MLKFVNLFLVVILVLVLLLTVGVKVGPPLLKGRLETEINQATGGKTKIGSLQIVQVWPLTLRFNGIRLERPGLWARITRLEMQLGRGNQRWQLKVHVFEPQIRAEPVPAAATVERSQNKGSAATNSPPAVDVDFQLEKGRVEWLGATQALAEQIEIKFVKSDLFAATTRAKLNLQSRVSSTMLLNLPWPLRLSADDLEISSQSVKTTSAQLDLGGLKARLFGESQLVQNSHTWRVDLEVPKIEELPQPPNLLPGANFRGAVRANVDVQKVGESLRASVQAKLTQFSGDLKINQQGTDVEGPVKANLELDLTYDKNLKVKFVKGDVDLSAARVQYKDLFLKAFQIPLRLVFGGSSPGPVVNIEQARFTVANIQGQLSGQVETAGNYRSQLNLEILPTNLKGLEQVLLPLKSSPLQGELSAKGQFAGELMNWQKANIRLESVQLTNLQGALDWKSADGSVALRGPFQMSLSASGSYENEKLGKILLNRLHWNSDLGTVELTGQLENPLEPRVNFNVPTLRLQFGALKKALPQMAEKIPNGNFSGQLKIQGLYKFGELWHNQNLQVQGQVSVQMPEYTVASGPDAANLPAGSKGTIATPPAAPILPSGALTQQLNLKTQVSVQNLKKDQLRVEGISAIGDLRQGEWRGEINLKKIFSGAVRLSDLQFPLVQPLPTVKVKVDLQQVDIQQAIEFAKPDLKDFATGRVTGSMNVSTRMPEDPTFMNNLVVVGSVRAQPLTLNSVRVGAMINDLLKKIPMIKASPVKTDPLKGWMTANFKLLSQNVEIKNLQAMDEDNSELIANGTYQMPTSQVDLVGTFFWAKPTVKGCVLEGNQDAKGRMQIPVSLKGSVTSPSLSSVGDLVAALGSKALNCEQKKLVEKVKTQGTEKLKQEVQKKLQDFFGK